MDAHQPDQDGTVLEVEPPRLLVLTWGDATLRFELAADGDGCRLRFCHLFDDLAGAASFASGWDACFAVLDDVLAGGERGRGGQMDVAHEQQVAALGLRVGSVEQTSAGWQTRVERQLVRPDDVVRPLLPPDGDGVRWELGEGTGHGARLVLTQTGLPDEESAHRALDRWHERVEELAAGLLDR
jgi:uncharacterized protein YndB with AHSA1/START domain